MSRKEEWAKEKAQNKVFYKDVVMPAKDAILKELGRYQMVVIEDEKCEPEHGNARFDIKMCHITSSLHMKIRVNVRSRRDGRTWNRKYNHKLTIQIDPNKYHFGRGWGDDMGTRAYSTPDKAFARINEVMKNMVAYMNSKISGDQQEATRKTLTEKELGTLVDHKRVTKVFRGSLGAIDKADYTLHLHNLPGFLTIKILEIINS